MGPLNRDTLQLIIRLSDGGSEPPESEGLVTRALRSCLRENQDSKITENWDQELKVNDKQNSEFINTREMFNISKNGCLLILMNRGRY